MNQESCICELIKEEEGRTLNARCPTHGQALSSQGGRQISEGSTKGAQIATPLEQWTHEDVQAWFKEHPKYSVYTKNFEGFDGEELSSLTKDDFLRRCPEKGDVIFNVLQQRRASQWTELQCQKYAKDEKKNTKTITASATARATAGGSASGSAFFPTSASATAGGSAFGSDRNQPAAKRIRVEDNYAIQPIEQKSETIWVTSGSRLYFPYGHGDFVDLRQLPGCVIVDKVRFIAQLEADCPSYRLVFIRPRRFGKTLFSRILHAYYDRSFKGSFEKVFGPFGVSTQDRNAHIVVRWVFTLALDSRSYSIEEQFIKLINNGILMSWSDNTDILGPLPDGPRPRDLLWPEFLRAVKEAGATVMVIIDEFDNFLNQVLWTERYELYAQLTSYGQGPVESCVINLFNQIKEACDTNLVKKLAFFGVNPMVLADLTSGMNIIPPPSERQKYEDLFGFTNKEVSELVSLLLQSMDKPMDEHDTIMRWLQHYHNGYRFSSGSSVTIYCPQQVFYCLGEYQAFGQLPSRVYDLNSRSSDVLLQFALEVHYESYALIEGLLRDHPVQLEVKDSFRGSDWRKGFKEKQALWSLLYYCGNVTRGSGHGTLVIPNHSERECLIVYLRSHQVDPTAEDLRKLALQALSSSGEIDYLLKCLQVYYNSKGTRQLQALREDSLQTAVEIILSEVSREGFALYFDQAWVASSTPSGWKRYKFNDVLLLRQANARIDSEPKHSILLELKYLPLGALAGVNTTDFDALQLADQELLRKPEQDLRQAELRRDHSSGARTVEELFQQAQEQARQYCSILSRSVVMRHGGIWPLDLRSYIIVGIGKRMLGQPVSF